MRSTSGFAFGANWRQFLRVVTEDHVDASRRELGEMLGQQSLEGLTFVDIGSGSGLSSLAARRMGAVVHSVDVDPECIAVTCELRDRFSSGDPKWTVAAGSILDPGFVESLGTFDIVYSWGVLHHTGDMERALTHVRHLAHPGSLLFIALYNDQGWRSRAWSLVKRLYNRGPRLAMLMRALFVPWFALRTVAVSLVRRRNEFARYVDRRGMSPYYDWIDWIGGHPFEVARPEHVVDEFTRAGWQVLNLRTTARLGCNEFVFRLGTASAEGGS